MGDKSSEYSCEGSVRKSGSYIYEDFMATDGTDVKVIRLTSLRDLLLACLCFSVLVRFVCSCIFARLLCLCVLLTSSGNFFISLFVFYSYSFFSLYVSLSV